jgi:hypothetical protein
MLEYPDVSASGKPTLKTRNVFLDTSVLMNENYGIKSTAFKSLMSLCRMDKAFLKLTDVTLREVEAHIEKGLAAANEALETKTRDTKILRNFDGFEALFRTLDENRLRTELMKLLQAEFKSANADIISAANISALLVFDKYFLKQPPFSSSKKKAEFPDAFVLTAIEDWCEQRKQWLYVVSSDGDMHLACRDEGPLFHLKSIGEFVDLILRNEDDETEFLAQLFVDNPHQIIEAITEEFEDHTIYLKDEDGSGEPSVTSVSLGSAAVVMVAEDEVGLELDATISFSIAVSYADRNSISYDNEEHKSYVWNYEDADLERTETVPVEITIEYEPNNKIEYQVTAVTLNNGEPVKIYVDEDAKTHWK